MYRGISPAARLCASGSLPVSAAQIPNGIWAALDMAIHHRPSLCLTLEERFLAALSPTADYSAVPYRLRGHLLADLRDFHTSFAKQTHDGPAYDETVRLLQTASPEMLRENMPGMIPWTCPCGERSYELFFTCDNQQSAMECYDWLYFFTRPSRAAWDGLADELIRLLQAAPPLPLFAKEFAAS